MTEPTKFYPVWLVRFILAQQPGARLERNEIAKWYVDALLKGTRVEAHKRLAEVEHFKKKGSK